MPGNDSEKRQVLSFCLNVDSVTDDVTSEGRLFQVFAAATPTVCMNFKQLHVHIYCATRFAAPRVVTGETYEDADFREKNFGFCDFANSLQRVKRAYNWPTRQGQ